MVVPGGTCTRMSGPQDAVLVAMPTQELTLQRNISIADRIGTASNLRCPLLRGCLETYRAYPAHFHIQ